MFLDEQANLYLRIFKGYHILFFYLAFLLGSTEQGEAKQRLYWTLPKLSTPEQSDRWSCLMSLITWQLCLARDIVKDNSFPWQKTASKLIPGRVAQPIGGILAVIALACRRKTACHTPATSPKPRGKSPGWKPEQIRKRIIT